MRTALFEESAALEPALAAASVARRGAPCSALSDINHRFFDGFDNRRNACQSGTRENRKFGPGTAGHWR